MPSQTPPESILIIGAGIFGLSTLHQLLLSPRYHRTNITLIDNRAALPLSTGPSSQTEKASGQSRLRPWTAFAKACADLYQNLKPSTVPTTEPHTASHDSSRIIRADYSNPAYAALAAEAQKLWRTGWGGQGTYRECGLVLLNGGAEGEEKDENGEQNGQLLLGCDEEKEAATAKLHTTPSASERYVLNSMKNVQVLAHEVSEDDDAQYASTPDRIRALPTMHDVATTVSPLNPDGTTGYVNYNSGVADASAAMSWLRSEISSLVVKRRSNGGGWLECYQRSGTIIDIVPSSSSPNSDRGMSPCVVEGVLLDATGERIKAELTILTAGAWSTSLLPKSLGPRLAATGQPVGYVDLSREEYDVLKDIPVMLNLSTGFFVIPPTPWQGGKGKGAGSHLKVARHYWGVKNFERDHASTEWRKGERSEENLAIPPWQLREMPKALKEMLRGYLRSIIPSSSPANDGQTGSLADSRKSLDGLAEREWSFSRLCWYTDTPTADFLIDFHPDYNKTLLVATGGSGHGFKFGPVIGAKIVKTLDGEGEWGDGGNEEVGDKIAAKDGETPSLDKQLRRLWRWRTMEELDQVKGTRAGEWGWGCEDGSRSGEKGVMLSELEEMENEKGQRPGDEKTTSEGRDAEGEGEHLAGVKMKYRSQRGTAGWMEGKDRR